MENKNYNDIPKEMFEFASVGDLRHDQKLDTKPVGYFKDAFNRFRRNKASVLAAIIIGFLVLYAIIAPLISQYDVKYNDERFRYTLPKSALSEALGIDFWDGCQEKELTKEMFYYYYAMGIETGHYAVKNQEYSSYDVVNGRRKTTYYTFRLDTYQANGVIFKDFTKEEYLNIQKYQNETGIQVIYPITEKSKRPEASQDKEDANYWFETKMVNGKTEAVLNENGEFTNVYQAYTGKDGYNSIRIEGEDPLYDYAEINQTGYKLRINYYEYYIYYHSYVLQDGISEPMFLFGTTNYGQDIFTCLASGARFSFFLAIIVTLVNFTVGAIYGAIEGYYGGKTDLVMERISDLLSAVPFMIVITLLKLHMGSASNIWALLIAFFVTGWIGMANSVRMQFYRFKNQEYVLAARTLGASDRRIMFKHIFPNSLGTLITGSVLAIPSVIFSESSLSYLGIINLSTGNITSVGTLLSAAQPYLTTYPHMILFPALFISLLMLSFNLFGNGLRDAFNPSLRGAEE